MTHLFRSKAPVLFAALTAALLLVSGLFAQTAGKDGYIVTGSGIRVKTVVLVDVNVYSITHAMKELPAKKSKQAVIDMDTDKKFVWTMMRDVDHEKVVNTLKDAYAMNGYKDSAKISQFLGAFKSELKEKSQISIVYNAEKKTTTVSVGGGGSATVPGVDFMKATWSIWFGKIDQPKLGDSLISKIPG